MAIDYSTNRGRVRALIPDVDEDNFILTDELIDTYLSLAGDKVFLATALALEAIAVDETLTYKITRTDDLSVNGVTGAEQLRLRAKDLRAQQDQDDLNEIGGLSFVFPTQANAPLCRPEATPWPVW